MALTQEEVRTAIISLILQKVLTVDEPNGGVNATVSPDGRLYALSTAEQFVIEQLFITSHRMRLEILDVWRELKEANREGLIV